MTTTTPTEPIDSGPRPDCLVEALAAHEVGKLHDADMDHAMERAVAETIAAMEATRAERRGGVVAYLLSGEAS